MSRLSVVTEQQALKLKQLGFNWGCVKMHGELDGYKGLHNFENYNKHNDENDCSAPDTALALKWLRDEKNILVAVVPQRVCESVNPAEYVHPKMQIIEFPIEEGRTYEQAESRALDSALNILLIQNKK